MMIIYNFAALIPTVISIIIISLIINIFPYFDDTSYAPYGFLIFFVVAIIFEKKSIKGRIFWLPLWLYSFIGFNANWVNAKKYNYIRGAYRLM